MDTVIAFNTEVKNQKKNQKKNTSYIKHGVALPLIYYNVNFVVYFVSPKLFKLLK